jgi:hypothetical protein
MENLLSPSGESINSMGNLLSPSGESINSMENILSPSGESINLTIFRFSSENFFINCANKGLH